MNTQLVNSATQKALLMVDNRVDIESVYLEVWSDDDLRHAGHEVRPGHDDVKTSLVKDEELNPYLGATNNQMCFTCENNLPLCPGHFGHAELNTILLRSFYVYNKFIPMILNCTCIYCWKPIMDFSTVASVPGESRLTTCSEKAKTITKCQNMRNGAMCNKITYQVSDVDDSRNPSMNTYSEVEIKMRESESKKTSSDISHKVPLKIVREMFRSMAADEKTRVDLGIEGIDVNDFFFSVLPIMPNNVRPDMNFDGRVDRHNFTHLYSKILENVALMAKRMESSVVTSILKSEEKKFLDIHEDADAPLERIDYSRKEYADYRNERRKMNMHVRELDNAFGKTTFKKDIDSGMPFNPILKKSDGVGQDINTLVKSKEGLVREKIMGKRVNFCARSVASPAPFRSKADEVWVPEKYRNTLLMTEVVEEEVRATLSRMAAKKMLVYVTLVNEAHREIPFFGVRTHWREFINYIDEKGLGKKARAIDFLKEGDQVERQLIDGVNYVMLNRQPSIWRYSMGAFRVKFWENATIGIPDVTLKAFNGDFDGDEFNIWAIRDKDTEAEVIQLFSPQRNILGNARNSTAYGLHYDPVTGVYMITQVLERKFLLPEIDGDYAKIADFLGAIENKYFEEQNEKLSSRRYFRVRLDRKKDAKHPSVTFSSETVIPNDYFTDNVRLHIERTQGLDLTDFHRRLEKVGLFFVRSSKISEFAKLYSGRAAFSILLPKDFNFDNGKVQIVNGILVKGTITKSEIGAFSHTTIFHELSRVYGFEMCTSVIDSLVWFTKTYLTRGNTLSFGLDDYGFTRDGEAIKDRASWVQKLVAEYKDVYETLKGVAQTYAPGLGTDFEGSMNNILRKIRAFRVIDEVGGYLASFCQAKDETSAKNLLLSATNLEEKNETIFKNVSVLVADLQTQKAEALRIRDFDKAASLEAQIVDHLNSIRAQEAKNIESVVDPENAFLRCEGKRGNIFEVMGSVGLQTISGKRIAPNNASNRPLASIFPGDTRPENLGMVLGNFTRGLEPAESAFLSWAARIGPVVTKTQTSEIGDIGNRMTNAFQGIVIKDGAPQELTRKSTNIIQTSYAYDNLDPKYMLVRKMDREYDTEHTPASRHPIKSTKGIQTVLDTASLQLRVPKGDLGLIEDEVDVTKVKNYFKKHIVNSFMTENRQGMIYVVNGLCAKTTQDTVNNIRRILTQSVLGMKFPKSPETRRRVLDDILEQVMIRMLGQADNETVHVGNGDKVGKNISGAIQQPIMQAALNSVVWEEVVSVVSGEEVKVGSIGEMIDNLLEKDSENIEHHELNHTEYLDVSENNFMIQSLDENGKMHWKLIEAVTRHDVPEGGLIKVKTLSGRDVTATVGKSFLVRRNNKIVAINGSELKVGDRLPVTLNAPETDCNVTLTREYGEALGRMSSEPSGWMMRANRAFIEGYISTLFEYTQMYRSSNYVTVMCVAQMLMSLGMKSTLSREGDDFAVTRSDSETVFPVMLTNQPERDYTRKELEDILKGDVSDEDRNIITEALSSDVYFDEIVSIDSAKTTEGHPKVYDFTVKDTRTFALFNGLNCMDTFHSSGQASSATTVKERFIKLITASASGKRSGTIHFNKKLSTFHEAYEMRNKIREISLASIIVDISPNFHRGVNAEDDLSGEVRKMIEKHYPGFQGIKDSGRTITYVRYDYDPYILRNSGLTSLDVSVFMKLNVGVDKKNSTNIVSIIMPETRPELYFILDDVDYPDALNRLQSVVISKLSKYIITTPKRALCGGVTEAYPTEFSALEGVKTVYKTDSEKYEIVFDNLFLQKTCYKLPMFVDAIKMSMEGDPRFEIRGNKIFVENAAENPYEAVNRKVSSEKSLVEEEWKKSLENKSPVEPKEPGQITRMITGFYLKTHGSDMRCITRNPLINYRCSYVDNIPEIVDTLGLRAARNFMLYETEQIFSISGSNEIDYRHVILMMDSLISQGSVSRMTFQGVHKLSGPNPLNQAGVGYAPTSSFAVAALKKKEYSASGGYASNFLATKSKIVKDRFDDKAVVEGQRKKISDYMKNIFGAKVETKVNIDYTTVSSNKLREREAIKEHLVVEPREDERVRVCKVRQPFMVEITDLTSFYGSENNMDPWGLPILVQ